MSYARNTEPKRSTEGSVGFTGRGALRMLGGAAAGAVLVDGGLAALAPQAAFAATVVPQAGANPVGDQPDRSSPMRGPPVTTTVNVRPAAGSVTRVIAATGRLRAGRARPWGGVADGRGGKDVADEADTPVSEAVAVLLQACEKAGEVLPGLKLLTFCCC